MKLNIEVKPKEWVWVAVFILIVYLTFSGKVHEAIYLVKCWLSK